MIKIIEIKKLFGCYDYKIQLKGNISIIYGPNGCGKTTILQLLYYLFDKKISKLSRVDFDSLKIIFENQTTLIIKKHYNSKQYNTCIIIYELTVAGKKKEYQQADLITEFFEKTENFSKWEMRNLLPFVNRISENKWIDYNNKKTFTTTEFIGEYYDLLMEKIPYKDKIPEEIDELISKVDVRFISADRLIEKKKEKSKTYEDESIKSESKVKIYALEIAEKMKTTLQEYGAFSQIKDRTFPLRSIEDVDILTVEEIKQKLIELEEKRKHYTDIGILESENQEIIIDKLVSSVTESNCNTLSLYAKDTEEKLRVLESFSTSVSLFKNLIDNKFSSTQKEIVFNRNSGFEFKLKNSGKTLDATKLSSGEQQELVLLYDLIFNTNSNTLILIDEPELSLHIKWQLEFIEDLIKIINENGFKTLIATHSPQIIDNRWDLTTSLASEW